MKFSMTKTGHQHPKQIYFNLDVVEFMILTVQLIQVKHTLYLKRESN
jgi:hypothetical protein